MAAGELLSVQHLSATRGQNRAIDGLSLTVERGEILGMLGPNGCGKSSTFAALLGQIPATARALSLDGAPIALGSPALRRRLGVVAQQPSLDPELTVLENLVFFGRTHGLSGDVARTRALELLARVEVQDRVNARVKTLSGGLARRVDLARALVHQPSLLFLDEPTTGLDERAYRQAWALLSTLRERDGLSLVVATHRPDEGARCDRIALLDQGRVVALNTPTALLASLGGEVVSLRCAEPEVTLPKLREALGVEVRLVEGALTFACPRAHEQVPRVVELCGVGQVSALSVSHPTLGDVFLARTGHALKEIP